MDEDIVEFHAAGCYFKITPSTIRAEHQILQGELETAMRLFVVLMLIRCRSKTKPQG
jgi:hypothetical protein